MVAVAGRVLSAVEVEQEIERVIDLLESRTYEYRDLAVKAAEAEAAYRKRHAFAYLATIEHGDRKMTNPERGARADVAAADEHHDFLVLQASRNSCRESLLSLREHLDALRTLSASVRAQT